MSKKLDINLPYGLVYGDADGAVYEQDSVLYRGDFSMIDGRTDEISRVTAPFANPVAIIEPEPIEDGQKESEPIQSGTKDEEKGEDEQIRAEVLRLHKEGKAPHDIWRELQIHHTKVLSIIRDAE